MPKRSPKKKSLFPTVLCRVAANTMQFRTGPSPTIRRSARLPEHPASRSGDAKTSVNAAEPTKQEGSSEGVFSWPTAPIEAQTR
jgi:hypothetical protein